MGLFENVKNIVSGGSTASADIIEIPEAEQKLAQAIEEEQATSALLRRELEEARISLEIRGRTVESLQDEIIRMKETIDSYVARGANDQLFYLTEFMQEHFSMDFPDAKSDVVSMARKLLKELKQRREGKITFLTKDRYLAAFKKAIQQLEEDEETNTRLAGGSTCYAWYDIEERMKAILGVQDLDDLRQGWVVGMEEKIGLVRKLTGEAVYYGLREEETPS